MLNTSQNTRGMMPEVTLMPTTRAGKAAKSMHGSLASQRRAIRPRAKGRAKGRKR